MDSIIAWKLRATALFEDVYAPLMGPAVTAACLLRAASVVLSADKRKGQHPVLQAGSADFRMFPDTVEGATCFGYLYEPHKVSYYNSIDMLPEMHCWAYDIPSDSIIDSSLPDQPTQAKRVMGVARWAEEFMDLPDFVVGRLPDFPHDRFSYQAVPSACYLAIGKLLGFHREHNISHDELQKRYGREA